MIITQFGEFEIPLYDYSVNITPAEAITAFTILPGGGAVDAFGSDRSKLKNKRVNCSFVIVTCNSNERAIKEREVRDLLGVVDNLFILTEDSKTLWTPARCTSVSTTNRSFNDDKYKIPVTISWETESPYWYDVDNILWKFDEGVNLDTGYYFDASTLRMSFTNPGGDSYWRAYNQFTKSTVVENLKFKVTQVGNINIADPYIRMSNGHHWLHVKPTLPISNGSVIEIEPATFTIKVNGVEDYAALIGWSSDTEELFYLGVDRNTLETRNYGTEAKWEVYWDESYI